MKINGPYRPAAIDTVRSLVSKTSADGVKSNPTETVQVSSQAQALAQARAPETPDMPKVQKLKEQIERGTFKADPEKIAEAMLSEEK